MQRHQEIIKEHLTGVTPQPPLTPEEREQKRRRTQEFIREMNEFVAKNGVLTDDEYFRVF